MGFSISTILYSILVQPKPSSNYSSLFHAIWSRHRREGFDKPLLPLGPTTVIIKPLSYDMSLMDL